MKLFFASLLFLTICPSPSVFQAIETVETTGKVVKIIDGDTFDLLTPKENILRVRMEGIDCPERKQDFYQSAKNALGAYIFKKDVTLTIRGHDRNKRTIASVYCNGQNINLAMIRNGYAWHFRKYSSDTAFAHAEQQAKAERKGLWVKPGAIAPWEYRRKKTSNPVK